MSEEREKASRCGWAALCLVIVLLSGLLPGSLVGGLTGLRLADLFGFDHVYEFGKRLLVLAGMITGLLVAALIGMAVTLALAGATARFRRTRRRRRKDAFSFPEH